MAIKKKFNQKYFNNDNRAIKYFNSNDFSKKDLFRIENCERLIKDIWKYKFKHFVKDFFKYYLVDKKEMFLQNKNLTFEMFMTILFERKSKHPWLIQEILNSVFVFESFLFSNANIKDLINK